jgi:hypothetical protein
MVEPWTKIISELQLENITGTGILKILKCRSGRYENSVLASSLPSAQNACKLQMYISLSHTYQYSVFLHFVMCMSVNLLGFILFFKIFSKYKVTDCGLDNGVQFLTGAGAFLFGITSRLALEDPPSVLSSG